MPSAENSIVIEKPRSEVFAFVANHENDKQWRPGVLDIERASGEGRGAIFRQGVKGPMGRRIPADIEVTAYEEGSHVAFKTLGGRTVRVGRSEHHRVPVLTQTLRELADGGRLARAVDPDDQQHARVGAHVERAGLAEQAGDLLRERSGEIGEVLAGFEPLHELGGCGHTDVGTNQRLFEPLPGRIVARVERR